MTRRATSSSGGGGTISSSSSKPLSEVDLTLVESLDEALDFKEWLSQRRGYLGFDIETTGLHYGRDRIRLAQFGDADRGWAIPVEGWGWGALAEDTLRFYNDPVIAHNAIFEQTFAIRNGLPKRTLDDSMVMAHLDRSGWSLALKRVAERELGKEAAAGEGMLDDAMRKQKWNWATVPRDFPGYWKYSALDPVLTVRLAEVLEPRIFPGNDRAYDHEIGAIDALAQAQATGMRIDVPTVQRESERMTIEMAQLRPNLPCNANAPKQIIEWLESLPQFETNLRDIIRTRTTAGQVSVDDDVLTMLQRDHGLEEAGTIREYRKRAKLKRGYFDNLLELHDDGIVHPQVRVLGAEKTGRMSISSPALQTLPRTRLGRQAFIAREGCTLVMIDFAGQELRLLAHMSGDEQLATLFRDEQDPHLWLATEAYGEADAPRARQTIKNAWYAILYGAGIPKFALTAGIPVTEAERIYNMLLSRFPGIRPFQEAAAREVRETMDKGWGYARTWTGRKLMVKSGEEYKATNVKIQGGCSEILKVKICELANAGFTPYLRLPIHDELLFEIPTVDPPAIQAYADELAAVMREDELFDVPFPVDVETAACWGDKYA